MAAADVVRARIDADLKKEATAVLNGMGLSVSDAIRLMLVRVVEEKALPFRIGVPNPETRKALLAARRGEVTKLSSIEALFDDLNDARD